MSHENQQNAWNDRYRDAGENYLFGTEPNRFLAHRAKLPQIALPEESGERQ